MMITVRFTLEDGQEVEFTVPRELIEDGPAWSAYSLKMLESAEAPKTETRHEEIIGAVIVAALFVGTVATIATASIGEDITGTPGADRLIGTEGNDRLRGFAGDDRLRGRGGSDALEGGSGDDVIIPGPGDDIVRCGVGDDVVILQGEGRDGADTFHGCEAVIA